MRTYVVCMDGTWNHPGQRDIDPIEESERVSETNVLRIYRFLTGILHTGNVPVHYGMVRPLCASFSASDSLGEVLYLNGVGSSGTVVNKAWAGATGTGTSERIMDAYRFLAERHVSGDRIFAFGFSRGAFAARSLAGFLQYIGLPKVPRVLGEEELEDYFRLYRERGAATYGPSLGRNAQVDFLGLWDTVGALAFGGILSSFHLISPENVNHVAHALALDERRGAFKPEYWESTGRGQGVDEVWFPGVHTNVGGGYAEEGLSNIALAWVVSKAVEAGLPTKKEYIQGWYAENAIGRERDSYGEFLQKFWLIGEFARRIFVGKMNRVIMDNQRIHADAFERIRNSQADPYLPAARLADGQPFPRSSEGFNRKRIVETPDYL